MALNESPTYGKERRYGIAVESTFGTAVTGTGGVCNLRGLDSVSIDRGVRFYEHPTGDSKDPLMADTKVDVSGSMATINISGQLNRHLLPIWLEALMQYESSSVYSFFDTHPSTPYSLTFIDADPVAGRANVYPGCVASSFTWSGERGDDDLIKFEVELRSKTSGTRDQTVTADNWQVSGSKPDNYGKFHLTDMTYTINDNAVALQSFTETMQYDEVEQLDPAGGGSYSTFGFALREGCTFECNVLPDSDVQTARTGINTGEPFKLSTAGYVNSFRTGQAVTDEDDLDGLSSVNFTANTKAVDKDTNMIEFDLS